MKPTEFEGRVVLDSMGGYTYVDWHEDNVGPVTVETRVYLSLEEHEALLRAARAEADAFREALERIGQTDTSSTAPDAIWLNGWRNNTKEFAREVLSRFPKDAGYDSREAELEALREEIAGLNFELENKSREIGRSEHRGNTVDYIYDKLETYSKQLGECAAERDTLLTRVKLSEASERITLEEIERVEKERDALREALETIKTRLQHSTHYMHSPILIRELDGSVSSHRDPTNEGLAYQMAEKVLAAYPGSTGQPVNEGDE